MSGMPSTFTVNTRVTLWFTGWTTTTTAAYVSSLFFIFILGLFSRLLGALKSQLGRRWREKQDIVRASSDVFNVEKVDRHDFHHRSRKWYHAFSTRPSRPEGEQQQHEIEPLSPTTQGAQAMGEDVEGSRQQRRRPWTACAPWNVKKNGINAILEVVQSLIGYLLYVQCVMLLPRI
jgi:hypothetical protein